MNVLNIAFAFLIGAVVSVQAQTSTPVIPLRNDETARLQPQITELVISPDTVSELHLKPNYATTILMPEPVADVVLGAPTLFDEEHSEHAPELVVVKPITDHAATSNLLISTRSGQHVSLKLLNDGDSSAAGSVDYVLVYRKSRDFLIPSDDPADALSADPSSGAKPPSLFESAFDDQQHVASPSWKAQHDPKQPSKIMASVGSLMNDGDDAIVTFSILNQSDQWIEILPPQIELNNPSEQAESKKKKKKQPDILADQIPIRDYRYTQRKLAPGARADGVVRFERPDYKQAQEHMQLELATADAVNRPLLLNLPFTAPPAPHPAASQAEEAAHARP